jgi:long-chain acyl-CoA synthetase
MSAVNLASLADENVATYGEYPCLVFEGRELTNVDQVRAANRLANALARRGVGPGDRVAVLMANCPDVLVAYQAILKVGAVVVPIIFLLTGDEVRHILADSEAKAVITTPELISKLEPYGGDLLVVGGDGSQGVSCAELVEHEADSRATLERAPDDIAVILYTSGTTGRPKGVALSHANLLANTRAAASLYELDRRQWALVTLPLSHAYGLTVMNSGLVLGTRAVLLRWFQPELVLETIQAYRVQTLSAVPTMLTYLLHYPDGQSFDTSSVRVWGSGAAPLPLEIVAPFETRFGGRILEGYGLTEATTVVSTHRFSGVRKLGSVGQPIPGVEVRIRDEADQDLPPGAVGEVCVRGPNVMLGYYRMPEETARTVRNGWLYTGDMGRLDADGYLYIVERKKDLIIRGGFNVFPRDVEEVLYANPKVAEAAVVGVPDALMGEEVLAFVVLKAGTQATGAELIDFCQRYLARYKCPKQVRFLATLPKSPVGKVLRKELRARAGP